MNSMVRSSPRLTSNDNMRSMVRKSPRVKSSYEAVLDYSGHSITVGECKKLCKRIVSNDPIEDVRFSDCLLSPEVSNGIINALAFNNTIKLVDFKGNNFRASGAEQLCRLLKQNTTLKELYLEWNTLGLYDSSMSSIAEGLAINESLQLLDLSNNQICHRGGKLLAMALKQNKKLKSLDLRWNNIGVGGGRELLTALQYNKQLISLQLAGNNIPSDTLKAINTAIQRNVDYHTIYQQHISMTQSLKEEIKHMEHAKSLEVDSLEHELVKEKELHESFSMTTHSRLEELKITLAQLSNEKEMVEKENNQIEDELRSASNKITDLEEEVKLLMEKNSELQKMHLNEIKVREENLDHMRKKWQADCSTKDSQIASLENHVKTMQENSDVHALEIDNLKNTVKTKEEIEIAQEQKHQREKDWMIRENSEQVKILTNKIARYLSEKEQLEGEIAKLKSLIMNDKLKHEEDIVTLRTRFKQEDVTKTKQFDERIDQLISSKDELQSKISKLMILETETRTKLVTHQNDIENYKRIIQQNQEAANQRENEHRNEVNKLHIDIDNEKRESRNIQGKLEACEKNGLVMQNEINQLRIFKANELSARDSEISGLRETIKMKEETVRRNQEEERKRTSMLEAALQTYISSARATTY